MQDFLRRLSGLGKGTKLASCEEAAARLEPARHRLDELRLRASRGWKTAARLDLELARADTRVARDAFYAEACIAMNGAVLGLTDPNEIRRTEQDAVWRTVERHGLARRYTGLRRTPCLEVTPVAAATTG